MKQATIIFFLLAFCMHLSATSPARFNVASYNIRYANKHDSVEGNGWDRRSPVMARLIQFHDFDIFGTQEGYLNQLNDLKNALPGYDYIGVGRDDGKYAGEHSAIFYRTDMFDLIECGNFWLSETPDKPSTGWDAVLPRICSWGHFRHKESGNEFMFFNLHMDHVGKQARIESARLVIDRIDRLGKGLPAILTGDFNVDQTHSSYATITKSGHVSDAYTTAELVYAPNGTFNDFKSDDFTESRIDHIFLTPEFHVTKYGVLTDTYRSQESETKTYKSGNAPAEISLAKYKSRIPSDHFPVKVNIILDTANE